MLVSLILRKHSSSSVQQAIRYIGTIKRQSIGQKCIGNDSRSISYQTKSGFPRNLISTSSLVNVYANQTEVCGFHFRALTTKVIPEKKTVPRKMTKLTEQERSEQLQPLLKSGWSLLKDRDALYKEYVFTDFNRAFSFMAGVALLAEKTNHHPEWFNVYNKVQVTMSTHDVGGLSAKDIRMATYMEEQAKRFL